MFSAKPDLYTLNEFLFETQISMDLSLLSKFLNISNFKSKISHFSVYKEIPNSMAIYMLHSFIDSLLNSSPTIRIHATNEYIQTILLSPQSFFTPFATNTWSNIFIGGTLSPVKQNIKIVDKRI